MRKSKSLLVLHYNITSFPGNFIIIWF